jgi:hypothetical protein
VLWLVTLTASPLVSTCEFVRIHRLFHGVSVPLAADLLPLCCGFYLLRVGRLVLHTFGRILRMLPTSELGRLTLLVIAMVFRCLCSSESLTTSELRKLKHLVAAVAFIVCIFPQYASKTNCEFDDMR